MQARIYIVKVTSLFGFMVDRVDWNGGFYVLLAGAVLCVVFCILTHMGAKEMARQREEYVAATTKSTAQS